MQTFQVENESTKMCFQSVSWEIFGILGLQQMNRREPNQIHGHRNHEATRHSEGVKKFPREGFLHPKVHHWVGINHLGFYQVAQKGVKF